MTLSVNKKTSRLAVLGELGKYPLLIQSMAQCLNYKLSLLSRKSNNNLIGNTLLELENLRKLKCDSWLSRVCQIEEILQMPKNIFFSKSSGKTLSTLLKSKFDVHFLEKIREIKISKSDSHDENKLRTYKTFKSSFTREPYVDLVRNRNQKCFLSRLRVSSHNLRIERGRHTRPVTPVEQRTCQFCCPGPPTPHPSTPSPSTPRPPPLPSVDDEYHFLVQCPVFAADRNCLYKRLELVNPKFAALTLDEKFRTLLCPVTAAATKLVHRFIKTMFEKREKYDEIKSTDLVGCFVSL